MYLLDAFPIEAGEINADERVLPKLSGLSLVMSLVLLHLSSDWHKVNNAYTL